jgi:hypothetical protein
VTMIGLLRRRQTKGRQQVGLICGAVNLLPTLPLFYIEVKQNRRVLEAPKQPLLFEGEGVKSLLYYTKTITMYSRSSFPSFLSSPSNLEALDLL